MNTTKLDCKHKPLMVAHRGCSGLERENTSAAFIAAGNRSYWGIETDIHRTGDGNFILIHDANTQRVANDSIAVEESTLDTLRQITLCNKYTGEKDRRGLCLPTLAEYIAICKHYEKVAVLELKNHFQKEQVFEICQIIDDIGYLQNVIFISFDFENLVYVKEKYPDQTAQFLTGKCDEELAKKLSSMNMDLDIYFEGFDAETAERCHRYGIKVNCWTVDRAEDAARLSELGAAYITSNILE